jgi:hypothetical protein
VEACLAPKARHLAKYQDCVLNITSCDKKAASGLEWRSAARSICRADRGQQTKKFLESWIFALLDDRIIIAASDKPGHLRLAESQLVLQFPLKVMK